MLFADYPAINGWAIFSRFTHFESRPEVAIHLGERRKKKSADDCSSALFERIDRD